MLYLLLMQDIYLLLGTNLGNRTRNLQIAKEKLITHQLTIKRESQIYETDAWGIEDQPSFLNQVVIIDSRKSPQRILNIAKIIEADMGRVANEKWAQRLIDIDILYFNDIVLEEDELSLPHPEIQNRRFTLEPLAEMEPQGIHPLLKKTHSELLAICKDPLKAIVIDI